jgi:hypothetical protein
MEAHPHGPLHGAVAGAISGFLGGLEEMPAISTFFGIVIRMYYREHGIPHGLAHIGDLEANWNHARIGDPLERIAPLD